MSSKSRKRSRAVTEENRADCPFAVTMVSDPARYDRDMAVHKAKKRKQDTPPEEEGNRRMLVQPSPFQPAGKFKTHDSLRVSYAVEPRKPWTDMTRYNSFVLNGVKYYTDEFVYVANETTIERQHLPSVTPNGVNKKSEYWVARILEVRASDEHHVYARVYWMYWPEELPAGTLDGKKMIAGRQPYHGQQELIASNHMDIINVVSVVMSVKVTQWIEADDRRIEDSLFWRQAFDCRTSQLSSVDLVCSCNTPAHPNKTLVGCTNASCEKWMHDECLLDDVLERVYDRLGKDLPHKSEEPAAVKEESGDGSQSKPNSSSPKVKEEDERTSPITTTTSNETKEQVHVKRDDELSSKATETPTPTPYALVDRSRSSLARKGRRRKSTTKKPWKELFDAKLKMSEGPTVWQITDLRPDVEGGEKTWIERAYCLICDSVID